MSLTSQSKEAIITRLNSDKEFGKAWQKNISNFFYKDMWERLDPIVPVPRNLILRLYGEQGCGKSWNSLFILYLEQFFFGLKYENVFSQMEASIWLVKKAYETSKEGKLIRRVTINIDEDRKMFGQGSQQEAEYFDSMIEFLRQAQISVHVLNPYAINNIDTQLEVIGYDSEGYSKSIVYQKIDRRLGTYKPMGYIVTKMPPQNYVQMYKTQKEDFLKTFVGNRSGRNLKDDTILSLVWEDMTSDTKDIVRDGIILNKEGDVKHIIKRNLQVFNLPVGYTNYLADEFKFRYFPDEVKQSYQRLKMSVKAKAVKAGLYHEPETKADKLSDVMKILNKEEVA